MASSTDTADSTATAIQRASVLVSLVCLSGVLPNWTHSFYSLEMRDDLIALILQNAMFPAVVLSLLNVAGAALAMILVKELRNSVVLILAAALPLLAILFAPAVQY